MIEIAKTITFDYEHGFEKHHPAFVEDFNDRVSKSFKMPSLAEMIRTKFKC